MLAAQASTRATIQCKCLETEKKGEKKHLTLTLTLTLTLSRPLSTLREIKNAWPAWFTSRRTAKSFLRNLFCRNFSASLSRCAGDFLRFGRDRPRRAAS